MHSLLTPEQVKQRNVLLGAYACGNSSSLVVINCRRWRERNCVGCCIARPHGVTIDGCRECAIRKPIAGRNPLRGVGDIVTYAVFVLFLGRLDIAERLAARAEALWARARARKDTPANPGAKGGCGCKARQQKLNAALPFGDRYGH